MKYILNSAVITTQGEYSYILIDIENAKKWLDENISNVISTIGYQETADALQLITGHNIPVNRIQIKMQAGDEALVFRLTKRLSEVDMKGQVGTENILKNCEIGILIKKVDYI